MRRQIAAAAALLVPVVLLTGPGGTSEPMNRVKKHFVNHPMGTVTADDSEWSIFVEAVAERSVYGRKEYLCQPVGGTGQKWVYGDRVQWLVEPEYPTSDGAKVVE